MERQLTIPEKTVTLIANQITLNLDSRTAVIRVERTGAADPKENKQYK